MAMHRGVVRRVSRTLAAQHQQHADQADDRVEGVLAIGARPEAVIYRLRKPGSRDQPGPRGGLPNPRRQVLPVGLPALAEPPPQPSST